MSTATEPSAPIVPPPDPRTPEEIFAAKLVSAKLQGEASVDALNHLKKVCDALRDLDIETAEWSIYYDSDENHFSHFNARDADNEIVEDADGSVENVLWDLITDNDFGKDGCGMFKLVVSTFTLIYTGDCWMPEPELVEEPFEEAQTLL